MGVDMQFQDSLLHNLNLEEFPWLPPKPWESIPSESGASSISRVSKQSSSLYEIPCVSEASLVRMVLNAMQGVHSAVVSIEQLSSLLCVDPTDRSGHRIPSLWSRSLSTSALGKMLKSFGFSGSLVILLHKFVDYYNNLKFSGTMMDKGHVKPRDNMHENDDVGHPPQSLVNQAFAVAVRTVLEGYLCALDTLNSSVKLRRAFDNNTLAPKPSGQGSLTNISHSEVTLLETYLHTKEMRSQIEVLGHLCYLSDAAHSFSVTSFDDVISKADMEILNFPRGGDLLTYLYKQLQVVDPGHHSLLKFLFLRSLEPYCRFIRAWIYEANINDPYGEFVLDCAADPTYSHGKPGTPLESPLAFVRELDGVAIPCFLRDILVPLLRAGQQLQVVMKLLRLCNYVHAGEDVFEDILPTLSDLCKSEVSGSPLSFDKGEIESIVLSRKEMYFKMHKNFEKFMDTLDIKHHQLVLYEAATVCTSYIGENVDVQNSLTLDETLALTSAANLKQNSEVSSMEDYSYALDILESSECSSTDSLDEQVDPAQSLDHHETWEWSKPTCLSSLCFPSLSTGKALQEDSQVKQAFLVHNEVMVPCSGETIIKKNYDSCAEVVELLGPQVSEIQYPGELSPLGWPVGGLCRNPLSIDQIYRDDRISRVSDGDQFISMPSCSKQSVPKSTLMHNEYQGNEYPASSPHVAQSWNANYSSKVLSRNPMLSKNAFICDASKPLDMSSKISETFPCFDFLSSTDPLKFYERRLSVQKHHIGHELFFAIDTGTSVVEVDDGRSEKVDSFQSHKDPLAHCDASLNLNTKVDVRPEQACGGSSWQVLLRGSNRVDNCTHIKHELGKEALFEMPLDFIIDKCLIQEIMLQYVNVSKLSIKLLKEGFDLFEHLHALRRYHFMEIADWADLFVTSLWNHKWYSREADQKIQIIQGLLELSIQKSSCEKDHNRDRLYVYVKKPNRASFSTALLGLHSFDFIGLGYKVDWPITIVLTSNALRIYAEIFTFLIQLKLAVLSLADVWSSLKDFKFVISESGKQHQLARTNFNCIVKLRHQVNHFVSMLQQYVMSQLSDVSWSRFCFSLEHEVKDMMDLESVHRAYMSDSLRICFLSDETVSISNYIEKILQCALDLQSCLVQGLGDVGSDRQGLIDHVSHINISQVLSIKKKFEENLKELHSVYIKSPMHGELGLPQFWSYLNYNEYYSNSFGNNLRQ